MVSLSVKEMEAEVDRALRGGNHEVLSEGFGLSLTRKDLQTLSNLNWLNDEVSTHYPQGQICVCMISRHSFHTRWTHSSFVYAYIVIFQKIHDYILHAIIAAQLSHTVVLGLIEALPP